jgi:hypothetical protein
MGRERSVITITLPRLGYLVHSLGNCAMTLPTEVFTILMWHLFLIICRYATDDAVKEQQSPCVLTR